MGCPATPRASFALGSHSPERSLGSQASALASGQLSRGGVAGGRVQKASPWPGDTVSGADEFKSATVFGQKQKAQACPTPMLVWSQTFGLFYQTVRKGKSKAAT